MSDLEAKSHVGVLAKIKKDPAPAFGILGLLGVVGYSAYNFKKRDRSIKPSVYIIQTRVAAQGFVIGLLTIGLGFHMYHNFLNRNDHSHSALYIDSVDHKKASST